MTEVLLTAIGVWLIIGFWLTVDGLRSAWPRIKATDDPLPLKIFGIVVAFVAGILWLPARFLRALLRHK